MESNGSQNVTTTSYDVVTTRTLAVAMNQVKLYAQTVAEATATTVAVKRDAERRAAEDARANKRNLNRVYMLLVALSFTFAVPYVLANVLDASSLLKYATGLAILPDALITIWALHKKY